MACIVHSLGQQDFWDIQYISCLTKGLCLGSFLTGESAIIMNNVIVIPTILANNQQLGETVSGQLYLK